jgi:hypothetical protein
MLRRQVSSPSLKITVSTIQSIGSSPNSPGLSRGLSPFNLHNHGSALASPQHSPRFLDFYPAAPWSPTITRSRLGSDKNSSLFSTSVPIEPTPPDASQTTKVRELAGDDAPDNQTSFQDETTSPAKAPSRLVQFEFPPIVIKGLPLQEGLPGFASFSFGNVHSVTYRSTCERLPTPYPPREDLDWLELQDEAELFALSLQEGPDSESSTPGVSTKSSPSLALPGFPTALCLSRDDTTSAAGRSPPARPQQKSLGHSKSLSALDTFANDFLVVTSSSLTSSRPSARPMLLSILSSALARRERSRRIRLEALLFPLHLIDNDSWKSSQYCIPTPFPSPPAGRVLDPDLMFDSVL